MNISRIGIDLAKNVFQLHGVDRQGKAVWRRRLKRDQWLKAVLSQAEPGCEIGMEACAGAHHWARELESRGYTVKLIAPQFVKPYVKSNKNDANDAEAIAEAMSRPNMRFVTVKSVEQQDIQATHRVRSELMSNVPPRPTRSVAWWPSTAWLRHKRCVHCEQRSHVGWRMPRTV